MTKGKHTYGEPKIKTYGNKPANLIIGNYCSIADNVTVYLDGEHEIGNVSTYPFFAYFKEARELGGYKTKGDVIIGHDVWIGSGVTILSGVHIGNGAVIGANSVVAHSIDRYSIVAGNPANFLRSRFTDDIIYQLEKIKWWDWPDEKIIEALPLLSSSRIEEFIQKYG